MVRCYVLIPFKDGHEHLAGCIESLLPQLNGGVEAVLVDDGSDLKPVDSPCLQPFLGDKRLYWLSHSSNKGPAMARNTGLAWCQEKGADVVILLDSDCLAKPGFVAAHIRLHSDHPDPTCIGGAIHGEGTGIWAHLDGLMSWFTSVPGTPEYCVTEPYHLPTTNLSLKMSRLPSPADTFNRRLKTGEDVAFVKELRSRGETILFSPEPEIIHRDRSDACSFFKHQHRWGLHTYVVRFGENNLSLGRRVVFALCFMAALPVYAVLMTALNIKPLLRRSYANLLYVPVLTVLYGVKGFAVLSGTLNPAQALFPETHS